MSDLISRQAVRIALVNKGQCSKRYKLGETWELNLMEIEEALEELPSVEPERKTGKWIKVVDEETSISITWHYECSSCGSRKGWKDYHYCPSCGAKMEVDG